MANISGTPGDDNLPGNATEADIIDAGAGNDTSFGGAADTFDDLVVMGDGDDLAGVSGGNDILIGDGHNGANDFGTAADDGMDTLFGGAGDDLVISGTYSNDGTDASLAAGLTGGLDAFITGTGSDVAYAGEGNDAILGAGGDDEIGGGAGSDYISGGAGNDVMYGGGQDAGIDTMMGGTGDDTIFNGAGDDMVDGGAGADQLWGGGDDDMLTGGTGGDTFGFIAGNGDDTITDFALGSDVLELQAFAADFADADALVAAMTDSADGVVLQLNADTSVTFSNLTVADFASSTAAFANLTGTPGGVTPGTTFTLTSGTDELTGTGLNDTFVGRLALVQDGVNRTEFQTLNDTDVLDGGAGTDTLEATLSRGVTGAGGTSTQPEELESIENLFIRSRDVANELDLSNADGVEQVWTDNSTQDLTVIGLDEAVIAGVIDGDGQTYTIDYDTAITAQSIVVRETDSVTVDVENQGVALETVNLDVSGEDNTEVFLTDDLETTMALNVTGASGVSVGNELADLVTLNASNDGGLTIEADDALENAMTGDGADNLTADGNNIVSIMTNGGNDMVMIEDGMLAAGAAIDLGAGDDMLSLDDNVTAAADTQLNGGAGTDVLSLNVMTAAMLSSTDGFNDDMVNFEQIAVSEVASGASATLDMDNLDGIDFLSSAGTAAALLTTPETQEITFTGGADADGGSFTIAGQTVTLVGGETAAQVADLAATAINDFLNPLLGASRGTATDDGAGTVTVNFNVAEGDADDAFLTFEENPASSGVTFTQTGFVASTPTVDEVQTFDVLTGSDVDGGLVDVTVAGTAIQVALTANLTEAEVATAVAAGISAVANVSAAAVGTTVTVTYDDSLGDVADIVIADNGVTSSAATFSGITTTATGNAGAQGTQTFTIDSGSDVDGGNIQIAGINIAIGAGDDEDEIGTLIFNAIQSGPNSAAFAAAGIDGVAYDLATDTVTLTLDRDDGAAAKTVNDDPATSGVTVGAPVITQFSTTGAGELNVVDIVSGGTVELTDANEGTVNIAVKDAGLATSTNDSLNIALTAADGIMGGMVNAASVESVAIMTTDTDVADAPSTMASSIMLNAASATSLTISGDTGVDLSGTTTAATSIDASGVTGEGMGGAVTIGAGNFAAGVDVALSTGAGSDMVDASAVGGVATVSTGAGDDMIMGSAQDDMLDAGADNDMVNSSAGEDNITLGDGNDTFVFTAAAHSTITAFDTITDFVGNTALDAFGAVAAVADRNGDVLDFSALAVGADIAVATFASAADATTFLANGQGNNTFNVAIDSTTGLVYADLTDDGDADSVLSLNGVTTLDEGSILI